MPNLRFSKWLALEGSSGEVNVEVLFRPAPPAQTQQVDTPPGTSYFCLFACCPMEWWLWSWLGVVVLLMVVAL